MNENASNDQSKYKSKLIVNKINVWFFVMFFFFGLGWNVVSIEYRRSLQFHRNQIWFVGSQLYWSNWSGTFTIASNSNRKSIYSCSMGFKMWLQHTSKFFPSILSLWKHVNETDILIPPKCIINTRSPPSSPYPPSVNIFIAWFAWNWLLDYISMVLLLLLLLSILRRGAKNFQPKLQQNFVLIFKLNEACSQTKFPITPDLYTYISVYSQYHNNITLPKPKDNWKRNET